MELHTDNFDKFSFEELKDEFEEILSISDNTRYHLQLEKIGPRVIEAYRKLRLEKSSTDGYIIILMAYARSLYRDFESYLRIVFGLDEDEIQLILKQYISSFVTYKTTSGIYTIKNIAEDVHPLGDHEGTLKIEFDDITMKRKLILTRFGSTFGTLGFDEKPFFRILLKFTPYWNFKPNNAFHSHSPVVYTSDRILNLSTVDKNHVICDVIDGSVVNGIREPILLSFVLNKPSGYKVFCEPETIQYKKINKSALNTINSYLDDNNEEIKLNQEI